MARDYVMPKLAMAMNEGTINEWLVNHGDYVEKGQPLLVVETEKVANELEAPESGHIQILIAAGETVPVESRIALFLDSAEDLPADQVPEVEVPETISSIENQPAPLAKAVASVSGRIKSSPLARKLAAQANLELKAIKGTGPGGRIVKRDIQAQILHGSHSREDTASPAATVSLPDSSLQELARIPFKGSPRASIARHMMESLHGSAQLSTLWESDISALMEMRQTLLTHEKQIGTRVSVNALIIKAIASAISEVPIANAALSGDEVIIYRSVNVAVAIALPGKTAWDSNLVVPVLRNVQAMGIAQIDLAMKALTARAREGALSADEMSGSTITLSTTAGLAPPGTHSTPILNSPNAVIIGPSTPQDKVIARDGVPVIRSVMPVSMTFDHRVLDGEPAARFANALHLRLENPALMLA